jgi:hypothetical protein
MINDKIEKKSLLWWEDCWSIQSDQKCYVKKLVEFCQVYVEIEWSVEYNFVNWEDSIQNWYKSVP